MRTNKIGILLEKTRRGRYTVQVVGVNDDRVVASVSELEESEITLASVSRVFERLLATIKLRLNRGELEFLVKGKDDASDEVGRVG